MNQQQKKSMHHKLAQRALRNFVWQANFNIQIYYCNILETKTSFFEINKSFIDWTFAKWNFLLK